MKKASSFSNHQKTAFFAIIAIVIITVITLHPISIPSSSDHGSNSITGNAVRVTTCVDLNNQQTWRGRVVKDMVAVDEEDPKLKNEFVPTFFIKDDVTLCPKQYNVGKLEINDQAITLDCAGSTLNPLPDNKYYDFGIHVRDPRVGIKALNDINIKNCFVPQGDIIVQDVNEGHIENNIVKYLQIYNTRNTVITRNKISGGKVYLIESNRLTFSYNLIERLFHEETYADLLDTFILKKSEITHNRIIVPDDKPDQRRFFRGVIISGGINNLIKDNELTGYFGDGISLSKSSYKNNIVDNLIENNGLTGISLGYLETSGDETLSKSQRNVVEGNIACNSEINDIGGNGMITEGVILKNNICDTTNVEGACSQACTN